MSEPTIRRNTGQLAPYSGVSVWDLYALAAIIGISTRSDSNIGIAAKAADAARVADEMIRLRQEVVQE